MYPPLILAAQHTFCLHLILEFILNLDCSKKEKKTLEVNWRSWFNSASVRTRKLWNWKTTIKRYFSLFDAVFNAKSFTCSLEITSQGEMVCAHTVQLLCLLFIEQFESIPDLESKSSFPIQEFSDYNVCCLC